MGSPPFSEVHKVIDQTNIFIKIRTVFNTILECPSFLLSVLSSVAEKMTF